MQSELASTDYFHSRARAHPQPTIEELRQLDYQTIFKLTRSRHSQQHPPSCDPAQFETGLPTPTATPEEDTEMSGTENVEPWFQFQLELQCQARSLRPPFFESGKPAPSTAQQRPNKRKHLADRDNNIPTQSAQPSKWPRRDQHQHQHQSRLRLPSPPDLPVSDNQTCCVNCGRFLAPAGNLHNCIYHPGNWIRAADSPDRRVGRGYWSCCSSSSPADCGCLISRHRAGVGTIYQAVKLT